MKVSVKNIITSCVIALVLGSCGKKEKELSPAQITAKADSIVRTKIEQLRLQAKEDLEKRLPIELKPKIDSLRKISNTVEPVPVFPEDDDKEQAAAAPPHPLSVKDTVKK